MQKEERRGERKVARFDDKIMQLGIEFGSPMFRLPLSLSISLDERETKSQRSFNSTSEMPT